MKKTKPKANIELRPSRISGVGVSAIKHIRRGTIIGSESRFMKGSFYRFYNWKDYERFDTPIKKKVKDFCIGRQDGFWAPVDFDIMPTTWYLNHCCEGNIGFHKSGEWIAIAPAKQISV